MFKWILAVLLLQTYAATFSDANTHYPLTFNNYINPPEEKLVSDTKPNWIHATRKTAFVCQGTYIPKKNALQVPPTGQFLITYIYHRPSLKEDTAATITSEWITSTTGRAVLNFDYSLEKDAELRVYIEPYGFKPQQVWTSGKHPSKYQTVSMPINKLQPSFRVIFAAKVHPVFAYVAREYLSQALVANPLLILI